MAGDRWFTIQEAAPRCSLSRGQLRRIALKQLVDRGEALLQSGNGRPRWVIREDALARLSLTRNDRQNHVAPISIRDYPKRVRDEAMFKARAADGLIVALAEARKAGVKRDEALRKFMAEFRQVFGTNPPSSSTLLIWARRLRKCGVAGLVNGSAVRRREKVLEQAQDRAGALGEGDSPSDPELRWRILQILKVIRAQQAVLTACLDEWFGGEQ